MSQSYHQQYPGAPLPLQGAPPGPAVPAAVYAQPPPAQPAYAQGPAHPWPQPGPAPGQQQHQFPATVPAFAPGAGFAQAGGYPVPPGYAQGQGYQPGPVYAFPPGPGPAPPPQQFPAAAGPGFAQTQAGFVQAPGYPAFAQTQAGAVYPAVVQPQAGFGHPAPVPFPQGQQQSGPAYAYPPAAGYAQPAPVPAAAGAPGYPQHGQPTYPHAQYGAGQQPDAVHPPGPANPRPKRQSTLGKITLSRSTHSPQYQSDICALVHSLQA